jgi:hypothetical protein
MPADHYRLAELEQNRYNLAMNDHTPQLRVHIRRGAKLPAPFLWEIYREGDVRCLLRASGSYPTRGSARKAGKAALQRLMARSGSDLSGSEAAHSER